MRSAAGHTATVRAESVGGGCGGRAPRRRPTAVRAVPPDSALQTTIVRGWPRGSKNKEPDPPNRGGTRGPAVAPRRGAPAPRKRTRQTRAAADRQPHAPRAVPATSVASNSPCHVRRKQPPSSTPSYIVQQRATTAMVAATPAPMDVLRKLTNSLVMPHCRATWRAVTAPVASREAG